MIRSSLTSALSLVLAAGAFQSARAEQPYVPLEQRLTKEQMRDTGLDTLSSDQLARLNRLLGNEQTTREIERSRDEAGLREKRAPAEAFGAAAKGDIRGWSRGDVIELDNGQRWRVLDGELYIGKPVSQPKVTLTPGALGAWYLQVEGQVPKLKVQRVP